MALQNFIDKVGPVVSAAWLNAVDELKFTVFGDATTKAAARTALTLDSPLEIVNGGTGKRSFITAEETTAGVTPTNYSYPPLDVRRYGAVGDGATTDNAAFVAAIAVAQVTGGRVYIPATANYYRIAATLSIPSNVTLYGDGYASRVVMVTANTKLFTAISTSNVAVKDLRLSSITTQSLASTSALDITGSSCCSVLDNWFDGWSGWAIAGSDSGGITTQFHINRNHFSGWVSPVNGSAAINFYESASDGEVVGNVIDGGSTSTSTGAYFGISFLEAGGTGGDYFKRITITGNKVSGLRDYGVLVYMQNGSVDGVVIDGNTVQNVYSSVINNQSGAGIYLTRPSNVVISNNIIRNCCVSTAAGRTLTPGGIAVNGAVGRVTIGHNAIDSCIWDGINVSSGGASSAVVLNGNVITNCGAIGIFTQNQSNLTVDGNSVRTTSAAAGVAALYLSGAVGTHSTNNVVKANTFYATGPQQVVAIYIDDLVVSGNSVQMVAVTGDAVQVASCVRAVVSGNVINSSATANAALTLSNVTDSRISNNVLLCNGATDFYATAGTCTNTFADESNGLVRANNQGTGSAVVLRATASPGAGSYQVGDRCWDTDVASGAAMGWIYASGAWKTMGAIS